MKGIVQQMEEKSTEVVSFGKFSKEDLDNLFLKLKKAAEEDAKYRKLRNKELESNRKHLFKRSKELNKEIPFEVAYHGYLSFNKTYVNQEFLDKYKEWF
jgi:hypothetical protein